MKFHVCIGHCIHYIFLISYVFSDWMTLTFDLKHAVFLIVNAAMKFHSSIFSNAKVMEFDHYDPYMPHDSGKGNSE